MGKRQRVLIQQLTTLAPRAAIWAGTLLVYINALRTRLFGLGSVHPFLDIRCKAVECLLNVDVVLSRNLEEGNTEFISELLALFGRDCPFSSQSHLFPMRILCTPSLVCCSTFENQVRMSKRKKGEKSQTHSAD